VLWSGAVLVATPLTLLNPLLGRLLIWLSSRFFAYGLVGGVIVLTLWVWLLGLILYFAMAWTVALARSTKNVPLNPTA
jgi:membrane protein